MCFVQYCQLQYVFDGRGDNSDDGMEEGLEDVEGVALGPDKPAVLWLVQQWWEGLTGSGKAQLVWCT